MTTLKGMPDERKSTHIRVVVEPSVYARLVDEKARQRRTMGDLVREALAEWLHKREGGK